jgi:short subunit dehydrogenase-like uncharacterized protein
MFDIVVFGATGFVGQIIARELMQQTPPVRLALAGRSQAKLDSLVAQLQLQFPAVKNIATIAADAHDEVALRALCRQTKVVLSAAGPYALHGSLLVQLCAQLGTDYCDLTGEPQWIARLLAEHLQTAERSSARLVPSCGFDSIPSDLGVLHLQNLAHAELGQYCCKIQLIVHSMKGGASGGTVASIMNVVKEALTDATTRQVLRDPYALCPPEAKPTTRQDNQLLARYAPQFGVWTAPFVMAAVNVRNVFRTHALQNYRYGQSFEYAESMSTGRGLSGRLRAVQLATMLGSFSVASAVAPLRLLLTKFVLPSPGEGPSQSEQEAGSFDFRFMGWLADGRQINTQVTGDRDPGYGCTAKMIVQAALWLLRTHDTRDSKGGFFTPAFLMGNELIAALESKAGMQFKRRDK